ncbi:MAG: phage terminase large subunit family protein [Candidatus Anstonellaceae archaeon]
MKGMIEELEIPSEILNSSYLSDVAKKLLRTYSFLSEVSSFDEFLQKISRVTIFNYEKFRLFLELLRLSEDYTEVFLQKSAQVGATTFFSLYAIYQSLIGRKVLFVSPSMTHFNTIFKVVSSVLDQLQIPAAKSRFERLISFITNGEIRFAYVSSLNTLRGYTAEVIFCDEAASYPQVTTEGDPFEIVKARSLASKYFKLFAFSTPTTTSTKFSIEAESSEKKYIAAIHCPRCKTDFFPEIERTRDEYHICRNCEELVLHSIDNFTWKRVRNDNIGKRASFFINVLTSPHTTLQRIREELKSTDISKRNLLLAQATETESFPIPAISLDEVAESEDFVISADIGYDSIHLIRLMKQGDKFYVDFIRKFEPNLFLDYLYKTGRIVYVDLGYFADLKELKNTFKLDNLINIRGVRGLTTTTLSTIQRFPLTKWNETYFLINKQKAYYILRNLILAGRFLLLLPVDQGQYIQKCFSKLKILTGSSGFQRWGFSEEQHDFSHFVDAIVYAFALLYDGVKSVPVKLQNLSPDRPKNDNSGSERITQRFSQFLELI